MRNRILEKLIGEESFLNESFIYYLRFRSYVRRQRVLVSQRVATIHLLKSYLDSMSILGTSLSHTVYKILHYLNTIIVRII